MSLLTPSQLLQDEVPFKSWLYKLFLHFLGSTVLYGDLTQVRGCVSMLRTLRQEDGRNLFSPWKIRQNAEFSPRWLSQPQSLIVMQAINMIIPVKSSTTLYVLFYVILHFVNLELLYCIDISTSLMQAMNRAEIQATNLLLQM